MHTYIGLAIALAVVAAVVWTRRNRLNEEQDQTGSIFHAFDLLERPRFAIGAACIFLYVGAEVAIGSLIVNYLMQPSVMGLSDVRRRASTCPSTGAARWSGRFIGAYVLSKVSPGKVLAAVGDGVDRADPDLGEHHGRGLGLGAARDRADEFDHVPDDLQPRERRAGQARGGRIGRHRDRDRRRRDHPAADRGAGR